MRVKRIQYGAIKPVVAEEVELPAVLVRQMNSMAARVAPGDRYYASTTSFNFGKLIPLKISQIHSAGSDTKPGNRSHGYKFAENDGATIVAKLSKR